MHQSYSRTIPGPRLDLPFRVVTGIVVIALERGRSLIIPAGGGWPGLDHLPASLVAYRKPTSATNAPDTQTESDGPEGRAAAVALVVAQALTHIGPLQRRFQLAEELQLPVRTMNQSTAAGIVGTARETFSRLLNT